MVYRIHADGRKELVRGVDLIGTPLTTFSKITAADDRLGAFNGICGAESGGVPVAGVSPAVLVSQIEVQKKMKSQERGPSFPLHGICRNMGIRRSRSNVMKGVSVCILSFILLTAGSPIEAQESVLMKALKDELTRTMEKLQLEGMRKPYFVAYWVQETRTLGVAASLGGLLNRGESSANRVLSVEVRVGDHDLDNTKLFDPTGFRPGFGSMRGLPLADDYKELRRQIWLATDSAYKEALDQFARKRAVLRTRPASRRFRTSAWRNPIGSPTKARPDNCRWWAAWKIW